MSETVKTEELKRILAASKYNLVEEANIDLRVKTMLLINELVQDSTTTGNIKEVLSNSKKTTDEINMFFISLCGFSWNTIVEDALAEDVPESSTIRFHMDTDDEAYRKLGAHIRKSAEDLEWKSIIGSLVGGNEIFNTILDENNKEFFNQPSFFGLTDNETGKMKYGLSGKIEDGKFSGVGVTVDFSQKEKYFFIYKNILIPRMSVSNVLDNRKREKLLEQKTSLEFVADCGETLENYMNNKSYTHLEKGVYIHTEISETPVVATSIGENIPVSLGNNVFPEKISITPIKVETMNEFKSQIEQSVIVPMMEEDSVDVSNTLKP